MAEIAFERLAVAREVTPFTAVTPPTKNLNITGSIEPVEEEYTPDDRVGTLEGAYRTSVMRRSGAWGGDGDFDVYAAPVVMEMAVKGGVTPTTPTNGVLTRLGTYVPTITSNDLLTVTAHGGLDPDLGTFMAPGAAIDTLEIESDAKGTDPTKWTISGTAADFDIDETPPTFPAIALGPLLVPGNMRLWLDTSSAIGTTEITDKRLLRAKHTIVTEYSNKFPGGQSGVPTITRRGRMKRRAETELEFEFLDLDEWNIWKAQTSVKARVRHVGPLIESVTPDYYHYFEMDTYGPFRFVGYGDYEGTNKTIIFRIGSIYDSTLGAGWAVRVQTIAAPFA